TPREREVVQLLAEGLVPREIAQRLEVSVRTVDTHRYQVMRKLSFRGLADLTRYALREGLISLVPETPSVEEQLS
ncbi:MAG: response regulator transcription factor, partial [Phycisphaeraceae bacterium]